LKARLPSHKADNDGVDAQLGRQIEEINESRRGIEAVISAMCGEKAALVGVKERAFGERGCEAVEANVRVRIQIAGLSEAKTGVGAGRRQLEEVDVITRELYPTVAEGAHHMKEDQEGIAEPTHGVIRQFARFYPHM